MRVAFASSAVLAIALCFSGCVGSQMSLEEVAGGAEVAPVMNQEELYEEIKNLSTVEALEGECLSVGGVGSPKLYAYLLVAVRVQSMSTEELTLAANTIARGRVAGVEGGAKLRVIIRLNYQVPDAYPYSEDNKSSAPAGRRFWFESPITDGQINYLHPIAVDERASICIERLYDRGGSYPPRHVLLADEATFFEQTFPKRDLSVYLEKRR